MEWKGAEDLRKIVLARGLILVGEGESEKVSQLVGAIRPLLAPPRLPLRLRVYRFCCGISTCPSASMTRTVFMKY